MANGGRAIKYGIVKARMLESQLKAIVRSKLVRVMFLTMGSTISAPGKLADLYSDNRLFRAMYIFVGAYGVLEYDLAASVPATLLLLALYDAMRRGAEDPYRPFFRYCWDQER